MSETSSRILWVVWAVLMIATTGSGWIAKAATGAHEVAAAILALAAVKIFFILWYFMELRTAPLKWRATFLGWLVVVTGIVLWGHWGA